MHDITEPLRLAVGSHSAGSGKGCAMNLISWESGDTVITDLPACADPMLARIVQKINDSICTHRDGDLLCPPCSQVVLDLGHRTVGTGTLPLTDLERRVIWVKISVDLARSVLHLVPDHRRQRACEALEAAENWALNPTRENKERARSYAAYAADAAAAYAYAAYAADAAYAAAYAADAAAAYAADAAAAYAYAAAAAYAADAAAYAADAAPEGLTGARLSFANRAFDLFEELTQHVHQPVGDNDVARAYACMTTTH